MSSSPFVKTFVRSSARAVSRNGPATTPRVSQRAYATERPTLPQGSGNKPMMIAALVGIPALAYFIIPSRPTKPAPETAAKRRPNLDPAAPKRIRNENEPDEPKYVHPEHENPDEFKPAFGQLHKQKRVDTPPDGKNHQALSDRART
ncbi:hypothetical protein E0Z10_g4470 [Xylaria hypoxylon]|uniref:Uncharacterized protein n=1 Tax=Xylaria hypoxylon TaxID=37992 RepID=A0A4Z0Z6V6_9PEZI|nr:hypothetical protein E0Z10_g4470 [Xylaria hypoxylon]